MLNKSKDPDQNVVAELSPQLAHVRLRGMYARGARKLRLDISYVSRVARGERYSEEVERALREEIAAVTPERNNSSRHHAAANPAVGSHKRLSILVRLNARWLREEWLVQCMADPKLGAAKLTRAQRLSPYAALAAETLRLTRQGRDQIPSIGFYAATKHGRIRLVQGYSALMLAQEYSLLRRCVTLLATMHASAARPELILEDLGHFCEVLDLQLQAALSTFLDL